jgi:hypothetical protein
MGLCRWRHSVSSEQHDSPEGFFQCVAGDTVVVVGLVLVLVGARTMVLSRGAYFRAILIELVGLVLMSL